MSKDIYVQGADGKKSPKGKIRMITGIITLLAAALIIAQLFLPALNVGEQSGSGYAINTYSGIDVAFFCWPAFILGGQLIGPNPVLIIGIVASIIFGVVWGITMFGTSARKATVHSAVLTVSFAWFGITWLMLPTLVMNSAYTKFEELVYYAKQNGMYGINTYAVLAAVIALAAAAVNAVNTAVSAKAAKTEPKAEKKPMTTKKAIASFTPVMAVLLVIMTVATTLMNYYSGVMDNFFGQGEATSSRSADASADYYEGILDPADYETTEASKAFAEKANQEIVSEGVALIKNEENALPLSSGAKITLLGANISLTDALTAEGFDVLDSTVDAVSTGATEEGWDTSKDYKGHSDAAVVTIYRYYGEGADAKTLASDGVRTELSLSEAELNLLNDACQNFDKVIVLVASSNVIECSWLEAGDSYTDPYFNTDTTYDFSNIKGAFWLSEQIGESGAPAVAQILDGTVNPSGHLVDTWISNLKDDPTYVNYGDFTYTNGDLGSNGYGSNPTNPTEGTTSIKFVEYEEGIYTGYRYYETAAYEAENGNYDGFDYDSQVVYPFGYGLSYTTFDMEYDGEPTFDEDTNEFTFNVKVTNTGDRAGKQVVQIYVNQPYTKGGIEKSQVLLAGYAKTSLLDPGASETVTITVNRDYITSYDYKNNKCYVLDAGDYNFLLSENAHSWDGIDDSKVWTWTLNDQIVYDENNKRPSDLVAAVNQMDDLTNWKFSDDPQTGTGYLVNFSRADFAGTYPTAPEGDDFVAQDSILQARTKFDVDDVDTYTDDIIITDSTMTSYTLADMRGVDYDDEKWDQYIEQFSEDKLIEQYSNGNWQEVADTDNGVPRSVDLDGPQGLTAQALGTENCQTYQANILIGGTWNTDMAELMGTSIACEMLSYGWTGWYGPGANIHRSQFGGRNTEYYSEDAVLNGTMAAAEVGSASEKGIICFIKHFAINSQELNRQGNLCTWVNEQTARELYFRVWEIYSKDCTMTVQYYTTDENGNEVLTSKEMPGATGIMTSYNMIGGTWAGACTETAVTMLRNEWGFKGISLTDAINNATEYMDPTQALYSGATDLCLSQVSLGDTDNDLGLELLQNAAKNVLYNKANSNCLQINGLLPGATITYGMSPWKKGLIAGWAAVAAVCVILGAQIVRVAKRNKKSAAK